MNSRSPASSSTTRTRAPPGCAEDRHRAGRRETPPGRRGGSVGGRRGCRRLERAPPSAHLRTVLCAAPRKAAAWPRVSHSRPSSAPRRAPPDSRCPSPGIGRNQKSYQILNISSPGLSRQTLYDRLAPAVVTVTVRSLGSTVNGSSVRTIVCVPPGSGALSTARPMASPAKKTTARTARRRIQMTSRRPTEERRRVRAPAPAPTVGTPSPLYGR